MERLPDDGSHDLRKVPDLVSEVNLKMIWPAPPPVGPAASDEGAPRRVAMWRALVLLKYMLSFVPLQVRKDLPDSTLMLRLAWKALVTKEDMAELVSKGSPGSNIAEIFDSDALLPLWHHKQMSFCDPMVLSRPSGQQDGPWRQVQGEDTTSLGRLGHIVVRPGDTIGSVASRRVGVFQHGNREVLLSPGFPMFLRVEKVEAGGQMAETEDSFELEGRVYVTGADPDTLIARSVSQKYRLITYAASETSTAIGCMQLYDLDGAGFEPKIPLPKDKASGGDSTKSLLLYAKCGNGPSTVRPYEPEDELAANLRTPFKRKPPKPDANTQPQPQPAQVSATTSARPPPQVGNHQPGVTAIATATPNKHDPESSSSAATAYKDSEL